MIRKRKEKQQPERRQIGVKLNQDLWRELKILALKRNRTAGELLEDVISEYLEKHGERRK